MDDSDRFQAEVLDELAQHECNDLWCQRVNKLINEVLLKEENEQLRNACRN